MLPEEQEKSMVWSILGSAVRFLENIVGHESCCSLGLFLLGFFGIFMFSLLLLPSPSCPRCCTLNSVSPTSGMLGWDFLCVVGELMKSHFRNLYKHLPLDWEVWNFNPQGQSLAVGGGWSQMPCRDSSTVQPIDWTGCHGSCVRITAAVFLSFPFCLLASSSFSIQCSEPVLLFYSIVFFWWDFELSS